MNLQEALEAGPAYAEAALYLLPKGIEVLSALTKALDALASDALGRSVKTKERLAIQRAIQVENQKFSIQWQEILLSAESKWGVKIVSEVIEDFPEVFAKYQKAELKN